MTSDVGDRAPRSFAFGPFVLVPERQLLLQGDAPMRIGGRALDILTTLVERAGEVVSKRELLARVWPDTTVEEGNLKVNMSALRRVLGEGPHVAPYIATVVGRGYRFVAAVQAIGTVGTESEPARRARNHNLPTGTTRIFGRATAIEAIRRDLDEARLVSIVGAGGIGKTTVALAVAEHAIASARDGAWLIDLALLTDPELVPNAIATSIGVEAHQPSMLAAVCEHVRDREMLLVLDNCEHVIEAAASCADRILAHARGVKILVTSREPLLVKGERVRRLPGLGMPPLSAQLSAADALTFPAIQLFVERATDRLESFRLSDADAPTVAEICQRLDGLALAIELAATRIEAFGVSSMLAQLDDRFRPFGRRAGPERHRTLTATLDWSYSLLSAPEAAVLRAVSVFAGVFDIDDAAAVASVPPARATDILARLAEKSLLATALDVDGIGYRLLETTRTYAIELLRVGSEDEPIRRRHAEHVCVVLERAASEWSQRPAREWGDAYRRVLDDLRGALAWAGRHAADRSTRIRLTVAGLLLWNHFSLTEECRVQVARAIGEIDAAGLPGTAAEMQLQVWFGSATMFTQGPTSQAMDAMRRALDIAVQLHDNEGRVRCLRLIGVHELFSGENDAAVRTLETLASFAAAEVPSAVLDAETALGIGELFVGRLQSVRRRFERRHQLDLREISDSQRLRYHVRFLSDRIVDVGDVLSHVQWLTGTPDTAMRTARETVEHALTTRHHLSLSTALSWVCPVFYLSGRYDECARHVTMLEDQARLHRFDVRRPVAMFYRAALTCASSDAPVDAVEGLECAIEEFHATGHLARMPFYQGVLAEALARRGRLGDAEVTIQAALDKGRAKNERWCLPELLRIQASIVAAEGRSVEAEALLGESMALAREIGALSWRLRAASALATLRSPGRKADDGRQILRLVFNEFTEGFTTRDLVVAAELLASLEGREGN